MARNSNSLRDSVTDAVDRIGDALPSSDGTPFALNQALAAALTAAAGTALRRWAARRRPGAGRLLRGALAGAGAAAITAGLRALWGDRGDSTDLADSLLLGAGKGVVYTAILDPVLPGPPALRGAITGLAEYMSAPWGGLMGPLSSLTPAQKLPLVGALLEEGDREEDPLLSYLIYGAALGLLAGSEARHDG
ncbi:MAG: hypothetical protein EA351_14290 [Gemmatimonadales bacterium]|nr:MAG: hypothetical protein EA351_14290 [Gemmatimonadales bacterium]